jgi:hypothetical protein
MVSEKLIRVSIGVLSATLLILLILSGALNYFSPQHGSYSTQNSLPCGAPGQGVSSRLGAVDETEFHELFKLPR